MELAMIIVAAYLVISALLCILLALKCRRNPVFSMPKSRAVYLILTYTWGLPMALTGLFTGAVLMIMGNRPVKYGWNICFEFEKISWGVSFGNVFISPKHNSEELKMHEHGHGIQNIYLGFFMPLVVSLPSAVRFWFREIREKKFRKKLKKEYDSIWFERSASISGKKFMSSLRWRNDGSDTNGR